jgi:Protein of unknown function (DUF 659)
MLVASLFFGCNIPFAVIDSQHMKNLMKKLMPTYRLPCSKTLRTTLLDKLYDEKASQEFDFEDQSAPLLIDGWKNEANNSKNVTVMLHSVVDRPIFLESFDFTKLSENGLELVRVVEESVSIAQQKHGVEIYAVVSDNAPAMLRMGRMTDLWHIACSSHTGDLLARDILITDTTDNLNAIVKEFKHPDLEQRIVDRGE